MADAPVRLLRALRFAALKHRDQRRKGEEEAPYVNHLIEVAALLADHGVTDIDVLQAAILHDTVEDTGTTAEELTEAFGETVAQLVLEMTDDKRLEKGVRKRKQIEHAPRLSPNARLIKIADKTCNVRDVSAQPPADWSVERRREYLDWAARVVAGCQGSNAGLDGAFRAALNEGMTRLQWPHIPHTDGRSPVARSG